MNNSIFFYMCILYMNDHVVLTFNPQLKYLLYRSGMQSIWENTHIFEVGTEMKSEARKIKQAFKVISKSECISLA